MNKLLKNTHKVVFILAVVCVFQACTPAVEDNSRLYLTGNITDNHNQALSDIWILTRASRFDLGKGITDSEGNFEFVSLDSKIKDFGVHINPLPSFFFNQSDLPLYQNQWGSVTYIFNREGFSETLIVPKTKLNRKALLNLKIEKTSSTENTLEWKLLYTNLHVFYQWDENSQEYICDCEGIANGILKPERPELNQVFEIPAGTQAFLSYRINSEPWQALIIDINQPQTDYELSY